MTHTRAAVHVDTIPLASAVGTVTSALPVGGKVLVATGQFAPREGVARVGVLALDRERRHLAAPFDGWLSVDDRGQLALALAQQFEVRVGEWDVMFATSVSFAWTNDGAPFELWSLAGLELEADARGVAFHPGSERIERTAIEKVEAYLDEGWVERGVRIHLRDGGQRVIARASEPTAAWDPTYDGIDVALDASWTVALARSLASSLEVPWTKHEALW